MQATRGFRLNYSFAQSSLKSSILWKTVSKEKDLRKDQ